MYSLKFGRALNSGILTRNELTICCLPSLTVVLMPLLDLLALLNVQLSFEALSFLVSKLSKAGLPIIAPEVKVF